jgi:hypothetical protein
VRRRARDRSHGAATHGGCRRRVPGTSRRATCRVMYTRGSIYPSRRRRGAARRNKIHRRCRFPRLGRTQGLARIPRKPGRRASTRAARRDARDSLDRGEALSRSASRCGDPTSALLSDRFVCASRLPPGTWRGRRRRSCAGAPARGTRA